MLATDTSTPKQPSDQTPPMQNASIQKNSCLWEAYQQHKSQNRMLFPLEGAKLLNVSELELMLASPHSQYLGTACKAMLEELTKFSQIESIVRNDFAVHEKLGHLENLKLGERMGIALNVGGLDLRFFINQWQHMLAVTVPAKPAINAADNKEVSKKGNSPDSLKTDKPDSFSIQFYDDEGRAICKVFLRDYVDSAVQQWQALIEQYATKSQPTSLNELISSLETTQTPNKWQPKTLASDKQEKLQRKWLGLTDIHQFHMLLKSLDIDRASSYRLAPEDMAYQLQQDAIEALLSQAKQQAQPIMTFVGNSGVVQIQTGVVHNVKRMGDWINILDKEHTDFTLHLNDKALTQVWCIKRPTKDGIVTCIEGFDEHGVSIVTFFGQRHEGEPERDYWREMTSQLVEQYAI